MSHPLLFPLLIIASAAGLTTAATSGIVLAFSSWGNRWELHVARYRHERWKRDVLAAWRR